MSCQFHKALSPRLLSNKNNKYEEALFKIEDERYEIDQAINLNEDVIKVLRKAKEEIEQSGGNYQLNYLEFTKARVSWIYQLSSK